MCLQSIKQRAVLKKSFIKSQFGYCLLIWIFHGRGVNNEINHLHERSLRIVYKDNNSSFKELIEKDNSFIVHFKNIQSLAIELFKVKENLLNTIMNDILQTRILTDFARSFIYTSHFGLNSLRYFTLWNIVPLRMQVIFLFFKIKKGNGNLEDATVIFVGLTSVI